MENLYLIRKIEVVTAHFFGETTSETPNTFTTQEFSAEKLHEIASRIYQSAIKHYQVGIVGNCVICHTSRVK